MDTDQATVPQPELAPSRVRLYAAAGSRDDRQGRVEDRRVPRRYLAVALILGVGLLSYSNSFSGVFVFDDLVEVIRNPSIRKLWPPDEAMFGGTGALPCRPIPYYTFAINYAIGGTDVWGYHAVNLAIHLAAGIVLFGLVHRTLRMPCVSSGCAGAADGLALAAALIWIVHPLQTESVTYVYQRMESLMGLFYLLTLYGFVRSGSSPHSRLWLEIAVLCCAVGMACKEVMVTAPVLVLWYDRVFVARTWREVFRRRWRFYAALAATWIILALALWSQASRYVEFAEPLRTPLEYALNQPAVILHYLRLTFFPRGQCLYYLWPNAAGYAPVVIPLAFLSALVAGAAWCVVRRPAIGFVAGSFFLLLAPTCSVVPVRELAFEHRMYLSLAAIAVLFVLAGHALIERLLSASVSSRKKLFFQALPVALIVFALAGTTYARNAVYANYLGMWQDVTEKAPHNFVAHRLVAYALRDAHRYSEAVASLEKALSLASTMPAMRCPPRMLSKIQNDIGGLLVAAGRCQEAVPHYEAAARIDPHYAPTYDNLGNALKRTDPARARHCYEKAIQLNAALVAAYNDLGALVMNAEPDTAYQLFQTSLSMDPKNATVHDHLGRILERRGDLSGAVEHYRQAARLEPGLAGPQAHLARLLKVPKPSGPSGTADR